MPEHTFATPTPIDLSIELGRGSVHVTASDTTTTRVEVTGERADAVVVEQSGAAVRVIGPRQGLGGLFGGDPHLDVVITLPPHSRYATKLGSADLTVTGPVGSGTVRSGSGDVSIETVSDASSVTTGSGDVVVDRAEAHLKLQSGSGEIRLGTITAESSVSTGSGDVTVREATATLVVKTGSGDLAVHHAAADTSYKTASGDLHVRELDRGRLVTKSASGEVRIGVRTGVPVWTDVHTVTGHLRSTLQGAGQPEPGQDHVELRTTTVSGDITLTEV